MTPHSLDKCYLGHSANDNGLGVAERLYDHLITVASRAAGFAVFFQAEEQAYAAGLLHDLGKYADQFIRRLRDRREPSRDHWSAGAALLAAQFDKPNGLGLVPAIAVLGHHAGLARHPRRADDFCRTLAGRFQAEKECFTETNLRLLLSRFHADGLSLPTVAHGLRTSVASYAADMLDVRMLFSALVDADFLETEAHFNGNMLTPRRPRSDGPLLDLDMAIAALEKYRGLVRQTHGQSPMAESREVVYRDCIEAARNAPGLFSLSAPTGAGKTLAMLAFALHHAKYHGLRRVVLVMPFLNIIEQAAAIYREVFSPANGFHPNTVLEHHSLADIVSDGSETDEDRRLLAENWDAPIILTTNVQMLESLMAARPARCRKLHRLAKSVILFDEVQTLPLALVVPTLATLSRLTDPNGPYSTSIVFATATQPAFDSLHRRLVDEFATAGWQPREIIHDPEPLYSEAARRVHVAWRHQQAMTFDEVAQELRQERQVVCIVNLKRHAIDLTKTLLQFGTKGLFHLSTNMCPAHRTRVLKEVVSRLADAKPVRLISTQCVEAGVDIDFPVVYRAMAPLEAIAQAAGRCNRHGIRSQGRLVVFKPQDDGKCLYAPGYDKAAQAAENFVTQMELVNGSLDDAELLNAPRRLHAYFEQFYRVTGRASAVCGDEEDIIRAIREGDFSEAARLYRLIDTDCINILVPYTRAVFDHLCERITHNNRQFPAVGDWFREAAPYAVSLFRPKPDSLEWCDLQPIQFSRCPVENDQAQWFSLLAPDRYDMRLGLTPRDDTCLIA